MSYLIAGSVLAGSMHILFLKNVDRDFFLLLYFVGVTESAVPEGLMHYSTTGTSFC